MFLKNSKNHLLSFQLKDGEKFFFFKPFFSLFSWNENFSASHFSVI